MNADGLSALELRASAVYAGGAVVYGVLLTAMGFVLAGGGHGVVAFFWVGLSGLILWPIAGAASVYAHRGTGNAVFLSAMSLQYLLTWAIASGGGEGDYLGRVWEAARWLVVTYILTYFAGQAVAWWAFASRVRHDG